MVTLCWFSFRAESYWNILITFYNCKQFICICLCYDLHQISFALFQYSFWWYVLLFVLSGGGVYWITIYYIPQHCNIFLNLLSACNNPSFVFHSRTSNSVHFVQCALRFLKLTDNDSYILTFISEVFFPLVGNVFFFRLLLRMHYLLIFKTVSET